jgi:hypothetical protein
MRLLLVLVLGMLMFVSAADAVTAPTGAKVTGVTQTSVTIGGLACGSSYKFAIRIVVDGSTSGAVNRSVTTSACTAPPPPPPTGLATVASAACSARATCVPPGGVPVAAATCASGVTPAAEVRPANTTANQTTGDGSYTWGSEVDPAYWHEWGVVLPLVQGQYVGTTDTQFQWAGCRWGFNPDLLRAVGVQESDWTQGEVGDNCGPVGEASYSIIQIKNRYCSGSLAWGGYPDTQQSTALAVDFYGAQLRACYDGAFYDGGSWLYGGQTVAQIAASHGWDYVVWGCVGAWYSGGWYDSGATAYIASVKQHLANRDWQAYG